jgi:hypothetical protein
MAADGFITAEESTFFFGGSATPSASPPSRPSIFPIIIFLDEIFFARPPTNN